MHSAWVGDQGVHACDLPAFKCILVGNWDIFSWMHPMQTILLSVQGWIHDVCVFFTRF